MSALLELKPADIPPSDDPRAWSKEAHRLQQAALAGDPDALERVDAILATAGLTRLVAEARAFASNRNTETALELMRRARRKEIHANQVIATRNRQAAAPQADRAGQVRRAQADQAQAVPGETGEVTKGRADHQAVASDWRAGRAGPQQAEVPTASSSPAPILDNDPILDSKDDTGTHRPGQDGCVPASAPAWHQSVFDEGND